MKFIEFSKNPGHDGKTTIGINVELVRYVIPGNTDNECMIKYADIQSHIVINIGFREFLSAIGQNFIGELEQASSVAQGLMAEVEERDKLIEKNEEEIASLRKKLSMSAKPKTPAKAKTLKEIIEERWPGAFTPARSRQGNKTLTDTNSSLSPAWGGWDVLGDMGNLGDD
jgi:hypothetical protein